MKISIPAADQSTFSIFSQAKKVTEHYKGSQRQLITYVKSDDIVGSHNTKHGSV